MTEGVVIVAEGLRPACKDALEPSGLVVGDASGRVLGTLAMVVIEPAGV